jgi:eukaryotic-like serine/threonine-protein kinase
VAAPEAQFGKYKLLAKIAAGGMAIAYRAELTGAAGVRKRVVLKVIHPHLAQEKNFIQMFISEAKVAASLTHGNIAQVFDFGQIDGRYYISMEEVIGQPLSKVLKVARERGYARLPVPLALQITVGVLDGLHYAHTRKDETGQALNLVHRDVTPDNVLLSYEGEVKVVDFGIAKTTFSVDQTEAGMVRGKFPYLSPEQASGSRELDPRADIWAAGVQLYDLLCGRRPYEGEFLQVMREIVGPTPVPSLRSLVPSLEPELDALVLGALNKPREERWATAREFSLALTNYLHQRFPSSTRQDVQFLLATLFSTEAAREGADITVPPEFADDLRAASVNAPAGPRPGPPVATEPPSPVALPRISAPPISARQLPPVDDEATGHGLGEDDLEVATAGLLSTDEEPTLAAIPARPRPKTGERGPLVPPPKKKSESDKKLKAVIAPDATQAAAGKAQPVAVREDDELPTLAGFKLEPGPAPRSPGPTHDTEEVAQRPEPRVPPARSGTEEVDLGLEDSVSKRGTRAKGQRAMLAVGLVVLVVTLGAGGFFAWSALTAVTDASQAAPVQLWVTSSPPGATITVDGAPGGKTPAAAIVRPGEHTVTLELAGYAPWKKTVSAKGEGSVNVSAELELVGTAAAADAGPAAEAEADAGAAAVVAVAPDEPASPVEPPKPPPVAVGEANFVKWPKRNHTLRLAKMALPLDAYEPLRIELNPKTSYQLSTQGSVGLGAGKTANALLYFLELEGPGAGKVGVLTPSPKVVKGARAIRVFLFDDDLSDNTGKMRVVARVSQYVPEKLYTFEAAKNVLVPKPEHQYRIEGMSEATEYLVFSRLDMPSLNKNPQGRATEVLCITEGEKPRPLSKAAHLIQFGAKVTLEGSTALSCFFPDDLTEDNSGSVELDIVDTAKASMEGVLPKLYAPVGKW